MNKLQPQELRVGNIIIDYHLDIATVTSVHDSNSIRATDSFGNNLAMTLDVVQPILITENWLKKLGFVYKGGDGYESPCGHLFYFSTGNGFMPESGRRYKELYGAKFIHQLQNLYFALTGQELKIHKVENGLTPTEPEKPEPILTLCKEMAKTSTNIKISDDGRTTRIIGSNGITDPPNETKKV